MILRAKYLLINGASIVEDGVVEINGGVIRHAGRFSGSRFRSRKKILDLGEAVLMPGLVNPHTHLEGPESRQLPPNYRNRPQHFPNWALQVIESRLRMNPADFIKTVQRGYHLLAQNGVTTIGDHSHLARTWPAHRKAKLRRVIYEEMVNLNPLTAQATLNEVEKNITSLSLKDPLLKVGVAPHAPYTISAELYKVLFALARKRRLSFSTHLSEMREEIELLKRGRGKLLEFLKKTGRDNPYWRPPGISSVRYLAQLGILRPPAFFVHCNYLSGKDLKLIARSGCSVVFCPNSQHYFGHDNHPFRRLIKQGVNVSLGTDSLASNQDLSILKEMRFVYENYAGIKPADLIRMGTVNGVKTLGLKNKTGELKPGYEADIAAFPLRRKIVHPMRVRDYLIETAPQSSLTMVAGQIVYKNSPR